MPTNPADIKVISTEIVQSLAHWSASAMENAIPIEQTLDARDSITQLAEEEWTQEGQQLTVASVPPSKNSAAPAAVPATAGFTTTLVPARNALPFCTVGKMYMTFGGQNYVGSAWVIAKRAVFTAGHCVFSKDQGGWASNILFVPQYDNGAKPVGQWTATRIHSLQGWTQNKDFKYDMGVFEVNEPIQPKTGSLGWMANYPPNQGPYRSIGYPASPVTGYNFNGQKMWQSVGGYINGSNPVQMNNNMTGGCSGGPWTVVKNNQVYANGLNSFRYTANPGTMYSPYFGNGFLNLYNQVKNIP